MDNQYPRPQFVRQEWLTLDGSWQYSFDRTRRQDTVHWQGEITVPYPPESQLSGLNDTSYHPVIWYRRQVHIPETWMRRRILLHFGAVDYQAQVWVNGRLAVQHEGGHTPFSADITDLILPGSQEIVVRAEDDPMDLEKPRGKQDWEPEPHAIWYPRTTGIWQTVWMEPVEDTHLSRLRLTPDIDRFAFFVEAELESDLFHPGISLEVKLCLEGQTLASGVWSFEKEHLSFWLDLPQSSDVEERRNLLWSPENPVLFDLQLRLMRGPFPLDIVESYAGLRSVCASNGQFCLNGEPYFLQMVLDQGYWQESLLAPPNGEALRRDVELTKEMGFNGARKHQKIEDPRYLYWADRLGLIVWGELPSAYLFSHRTARRLAQEFIAEIERDFNHPCIVAWVPLNESWGVPDVANSNEQRHLAQSLFHLGKALDPTRLVVDNDGWEHVISDLFTIHDYENNPAVFSRRYGTPEGYQEVSGYLSSGHPVALDCFQHQGLPVILSEFGGVRLGEGKGWGYVTANTAEDFLKLFAPLMQSVYGRNLTGYCYTQLTDTFQEQNGLLYMDRRPKVDPAIVRQILEDGMRQRKQAQQPVG